MLNILIVLVMIIALIYGISKKYNTVMLLLGVAILSLALFTLLTGESVLGAETTGSRFLDIFAIISTTAKSQMSGTILLAMSLLGYVSYINYMKASTLFALLVVEPLRKLRNGYIIVGLSIIVGAYLNIVINSSVSFVTLLLGTMYPVMRMLGVSRATCASSIIVSSVFSWGPDSVSYVVLSYLKEEIISCPEWFVRYQLAPVSLALIPMVLVFIATSVYFDRKEGVESGLEEEFSGELSVESLGIPKYFAILPLLPLIFVIVFSDMVIPGMSFDMTSANFLSLFIAMGCNLLHKRRFREVLDSAKAFMEGCGQYMTSVGLMMIAGSAFAAAVNKWNGIEMLLNLLHLDQMQNGWKIMTVIMSLMAFASITVFGNVTANMHLFAPIMVSVAETLNGDILRMLVGLTMCGGMGATISPIFGAMVVVCGHCKVSINQMIKRNLIPSFSGACFVLFFLLLLA